MQAQFTDLPQYLLLRVSRGINTVHPGTKIHQSPNRSYRKGFARGDSAYCEPPVLVGFAGGVADSQRITFVEQALFIQVLWDAAGSSES
jgi:hypothetical protein